MHRTLILASCLLGLMLAGCRRTEDSAMIDHLLKEAKSKFVPDKRTMVFDVRGEMSGGRLTLKGEVQNAALKDQLLQYLREKKEFEIIDSVVVLPESSLGEKIFAVVSVSVANIRTRPKHSAEMGTQAILGTPLKVLKREDGDWYLVQTPDDYLGWTDDLIVRMTKEEYGGWLQQPKVIVTTEFGFTRQWAEKTSQAVSDVVAGGLLALKKDHGSHYEVTYPDGRTAFLRKDQAEPFSPWLGHAKDTPESIVATAKRFFGVPYFWGGTSAKAMDCSGFTKTVYFLNGVLLPRDASQQVLVGDPVETANQMAGVQAGDLLFFGGKATDQKPERVTHVAISLGGQRFIHASGDVRINSLNPADPDYSRSREMSFLRAKRIIGAGEQSGVRRLAQMAEYNPAK